MILSFLINAYRNAEYEMEQELKTTILHNCLINEFMLCLLKILEVTEMLKLYYIFVDETINIDIFQHYLSYVSNEKHVKIEKFRYAIDQKLCLYADVLVRAELCRLLHVPNSQIHFTYNKYGKPSVENNSKIHFNISHTRNSILVGLSDTPIGVDIEKIQNTNFQIADHFFTKCESEYIHSTKENQENRFYEVWTRKEAYIKYIGKGLSLKLDSFDTTSGKIADLLFTTKYKDYCMSICSASKSKCSLLEIKESDLENHVRKYIID